MTAHSVIGMLVAVAVPLWLVVEQVLYWRAVGQRPASFRAWIVARRPPKATTQDCPRELAAKRPTRKAS